MVHYHFLNKLCTFAPFIKLPILVTSRLLELEVDNDVGDSYLARHSTARVCVGLDGAYRTVV